MVHPFLVTCMAALQAIGPVLQSLVLHPDLHLDPQPIGRLLATTAATNNTLGNTTLAPTSVRCVCFVVCVLVCVWTMHSGATPNNM